MSFYELVVGTLLKLTFPNQLSRKKILVINVMIQWISAYDIMFTFLIDLL